MATIKAETQSKFFNPSNINEALAPLIFISRLAGILPFKYNINEQKFQFTIFGGLSTICHLTIFAVCFVFAIQENQSIVGYFYNTDISNIGDKLQLVTGLSTISVIFVSCIIRRYKFIKSMNLFSQIDVILEEYGVDLHLRYTKIRLMISILILFMVFIVFTGGSIIMLNFMNIYPPFMTHISYFLPFVTVALVSVQFKTSVYIIYSRFEYVNRILKNMCKYNLHISHDTLTRASDTFKRVWKRNKTHNAEIKDEEEILTKLEMITKLHDLLCDAANMINEYFAPQLLNIITISFIIIVFNLYYILEGIMSTTNANKQDIQRISFFVFFIYQTIHLSFGVLVIVRYSTCATDEANKTAVYVHKILNETGDENLREKLTYMSLQLLHRQPQFSACGLFPLDYTLIYSIAGAATTYLVILVQFTDTLPTA